VDAAYAADGAKALYLPTTCDPSYGVVEPVPVSCSDRDTDDFATGTAVSSFYPGRTCAQMRTQDTSGGDYAALGFSDPCTLTWAEIVTKKMGYGTVVAPAGYVGKTFAQSCPVTCNACPAE
jgi:hypothetical protein